MEVQQESVCMCVRLLCFCNCSGVLLTAPPTLSTGLAVDYFNERLYWADAKLSLICSVRLNGSDPVVAINSIKNS